MAKSYSATAATEIASTLETFTTIPNANYILVCIMTIILHIYNNKLTT